MATDSNQDELEKINQAIAGQEGLRGLGIMAEAGIDAKLERVRRRREALPAQASQPAGQSAGNRGVLDSSADC